LLSLIFISLAYGENIYRWVDKNGGVHYTDDESMISFEYRDGVKSEQVKPSASPLLPVPQKSNESRGDNSGQGEDYWRAKVQPWKRQLNEASANLEQINRQIEKKYEERSKYSTPIPWNMDRAERNQLLEEKSKYEAQITEANAMLEKIAKEAREANADPTWLQ